jgi:di/tricarboxylate transporter
VNIDLWITILILVGLVAALVRELAPPPTAMFGALVAMVLSGTVDASDALQGFSSTATATVAGLFVVAYALRKHAGVELMIQRGLAGAESDRSILARLCLPVAAASSVIANTPLVAALAPVVRSWSDRAGRPPSRVLIPLSFATILGGTITTIGTSTTLVASALVASETGTPFSLLEVTPLGLPMALMGLVVLVLLAPKLLPDRSAATGAPGDRSYSFRMVVQADGPLDGLTLADAGLRQLDAMFVAAIDRGAAGTTTARPDSRLLGGDELVIVGDMQAVRDLAMPGLQHAEEHQVAALTEDRTGLLEVVVGTLSPLAGRTLKQVSFRGRYGAAVLAIYRDGERIDGKLGQQSLQVGDALLLRAGPLFVDSWRDSHDFAVVAPLDDDLVEPSTRRPLVLLVTLGMVVAAGFGLLPLVDAVLWACAVLVVTRTLRFREALDSLDLDVLLIIAAAIGIGRSVEVSGLAEIIAQAIAAVAGQGGAALALLALLVGTTILTEVVTNVASAALLVPIAMQTATMVGANPRGWAVAVAVLASSSFLTPVGYQTNTIVYGLGGYKFSDYWRLGLPLVLISIATTMVVVPIVWG